MELGSFHLNYGQPILGEQWPNYPANLLTQVLNALQANLNTAHGIVPIPSGQAYITIGNLALGFTPAVCVCTISQPASGDQLWATLVYGTLTTAGFTATFNGTVPATGYYLNYIIY